jgi:hypothetical protein
MDTLTSKAEPLQCSGDENLSLDYVAAHNEQAVWDWLLIAGK